MSPGDAVIFGGLKVSWPPEPPTIIQWSVEAVVGIEDAEGRAEERDEAMLVPKVSVSVESGMEVGVLVLVVVMVSRIRVVLVASAVAGVLVSVAWTVEETVDVRALLADSGWTPIAAALNAANWSEGLIAKTIPFPQCPVWAQNAHIGFVSATEITAPGKGPSVLDGSTGVLLMGIGE